MADDDDDLGENTLKIIPFSGEPEDWLDWEFKFYSKAVLCGYVEIIDGEITAPDDTVTTPNDNQKKVRRLNQLAYHSLVVSCSGIALRIVRDARTTDTRKGDAKRAWDALKAKYAGTTTNVAIDLEKIFHECCLKNEDEDPDVWLQRLHHLRGRLRAMEIDKTDATIIAVIMSGVPDAYDMVKTSLSGSTKLQTLTLNELETDIWNFY